MRRALLLFFAVLAVDGWGDQKPDFVVLSAKFEPGFEGTQQVVAEICSAAGRAYSGVEITVVFELSDAAGSSLGTTAPSTFSFDRIEPGEIVRCEAEVPWDLVRSATTVTVASLSETHAGELASLDELRAAVLSDRVTVIRDWLQNQPPAGPEDMILVEQVFFIALDASKNDSVAAILDSGVEVNDLQTPDGTSALYEAAEAGNEAMIRLLLAHGADPLRGVDPLSLRKALSKHNNRYIELCLDKGLDPDATYNQVLDNDTLLNEAIKLSNLEAFSLLLDRGADIGTVGIQNGYKTTLALALEHQGAQSDYVRLLKEKGAYEKVYSVPGSPTARSSTDRLRVRASPDLSGAVIGFLKKGDVVQIEEVTPLVSLIDGFSAPWVKVRKGTLEGWAFGGYLSWLRGSPAS